jgi:dihydroflavonol-4-reductase
VAPAPPGGLAEVTVTMCSERVRVLVTGASGFVGKALVARLVARGHAVRALARPTSQVGDLVRLGAELVPGDLAGAGALASALDGCEAVFHVAGAVKALDGDALVRVNAEGTRNVAQACAARPRPPVLVYGRSKLGGEEAVREVAGAVPVTIVRPPIVYGPGDKELLPPLLKMARIGVVLRAGFGAKRYSLVHVSDLCDGLVAVAERGRRARAAGPEGVYYLDGGAVHTWDEIARAVCAALGRRAAVLPIPEVVGYAAAAGASLRAAVTGKAQMLSFDKLREMREHAWTCSSERARRELGFSPRYGLEEGMRDAVSWFVGRGL